jgi:hypothetical protein
MFIAVVPILVIGTAVLMEEMKTRPLRLRIFTGIAGFLLVWNVLSILQYRLGYISLGGENTLRDLTVGRVEMVTALLQRVF